MIIYIKNMVCLRCKMVVETLLERLDIPYLKVELGKVNLLAALVPGKQQQLVEGLRHYELELMDNKKKILTEKVKVIVIELFATLGKEMLSKFSEYLSKELQYDYTYIANTFAETEGTTVEKFFISYRIERVKELMVYDELTIKEISYRLNFSSVSHLSQQFKKVTGQTPAMFRKLCASEDYEWRTCE